MSARKDLTGMRFGRLYVVEYAYTDSRGGSCWVCKCDCGREVTIRSSNLISGNTTSCGCKKYNHEDLTGRKFGRLTVLAYSHTDNRGNRHWQCVCNCGNMTIVAGQHLKSGSTTSCGCRQREIASKVNMTHGMRNTRLYHIWDHMRQRCNNPSHNSYVRYGNRGIFVCDEWLSFENFRDWALNNGYEEDLSIDRIDVNDGYYPENCRWADSITQQNNRRNNHYVTWGGESHTIAEWARIFGITYNALYYKVLHDNMSDFEEYFANVGDING